MCPGWTRWDSAAAAAAAAEDRDAEDVNTWTETCFRNPLHTHSSEVMHQVVIIYTHFHVLVKHYIFSSNVFTGVVTSRISLKNKTDL